MSFFVKPNREQLRFQSLDLESLIPENHPVKFFWKVCEELDLTNLYADYKITEDSEGRPANDPRVLLCLWIYAYSQGIQSSRQLAQACKTRADFMWLCGDITPEYRTLAYFRINHTKAMEDAFCKMVMTLKKLGLIKEKVFFQDGTKLMANASAKSFSNRNQLNQERNRLERALEKVQIAYHHFTSYPEEGIDVINQPQIKLAKKLKNRLREVRKAIKQVNRIYERRQRLSKRDRDQYPPKNAQASLTDSDSQFMLNDGRIKPSYNGQICLDGESEFIVAKEVSNQPTDVNRLLPMVDEVKNNLKVKELVGAYVTDSGYYKDENIWWAKEAGVKKLILPIKIEPKCPETIEVKRNAESEEGKGLLKKRNATIERIIGYIKERLRVRRFSLRGLVKVGCEWTFICLAYNLIRYMQLVKVKT
jgi:transposase